MDTTSADELWLTHARWLGNSPLAWLIAACSAVAGFLIVLTVVHIVRRRIIPLAARVESRALRSVEAAIGAIRRWLLLVIAVLSALSALEFPVRVEFWLHTATFVVVGLQIVFCLNRAVVTGIRYPDDFEGDAPVMLGIITWIAQFVIWVTFLLALLTNAGINITAFVASLGIGGIAIALALQNILGDLFASVSIGLDKPFEPGDFIQFGADLGTVKHVGIKSTRVESLSGEQLSIANSQLLNALIHNYSRMDQRRVVFGFTVPYETSRETLLAITERTNDVISTMDEVRFDRGHFTGFGEDGFTFEFVYYVTDASYTLYRDIQQDINTRIMDVLADLGVRFAVPARTVAMRQD